MVLSVKNHFFLYRIIKKRHNDDRSDLAHHLLRKNVNSQIYSVFENEMIQNLKQKQTDERRNYRYRNEIREFFSLRMFTSFKHKPDAQKIIGDNSATCGQDITKRIFNSGQIIFPRE